jgi:23S rRNA (pseudouridine1915-N3)-methyltransferase
LEIPDEDCDMDNAAAAKEGEKILSKISERDYVIGLDPNGAMIASEAFAEKINSLFVSGHSNLCFLVGGSVGLSQQVKNRCNELVSFSPLTFPHQLFRLILLEQLYRCFKINANETYHK